LDNNIFNAYQLSAMYLYRILFGHYWLYGFNFGITKDAYQKSGGFNAHLNAMEDVELGKRVAKVGRIKYLPQLVVVFSGRRFQKGFIRGILSYVKLYWECFFLKDSKIDLSDVR